MIMPGVQKPHCRAWFSWKACLHRVQLAVRGQTLDGGDLVAVGLDGEHRAGLDARPSRWTVQAPQLLVSQPTTVPVLPSCSRR